MPPEIAVVGSLNLDIVVPVPEHPAPGDTVLGGDHRRHFGGKGANQAVAAARLGRTVAMTGRVGDDEPGRSLTSALAGDGVSVDGVRVDPDAPTGLALITVDPSGENAIVVSPGANARLSVEDVSEDAASIAGAGVVLLQLEIPIEAVTRAADATEGTVILNPAPARPLPGELLRAIDVLVPNRGELAVLAGGLEDEEPDALVAAARALEGPGAIVVTLGAEGSLLVTMDDALHVPAFDVEPVDTTGAGDAFCGALADALVRGEKLADAVRWATAAGACAVTRPGAQDSLPTRAEVEQLLA
jgi:ribokinase